MEWFYKHPQHNEFKQKFINDQLTYARKMAIFAITYYFFFGFLDYYLSDETTWQILKTRVIITLVMALLLAFSFHQKIQHHWQFFIGLLVFTAGLGVIIMSSYLPTAYKPIYEQGLLLVIFYGYTMNKLLLKPAILAGLAITAVYFICAYYIFSTPTEYLVTSLYFQISTNVFGMFSVYFMQKATFHEYLKTQSLQNHNKSLIHQSETDGLTGIGNRRYFDQRFQQLFENEIRNHQFMSVLLCDIDFFKNYNDTYGHLKGDDALKQVAKILANQLSPDQGILARFGGEEFILVLFNHDYQATEAFIDTIQNEIKKQAIEHKSSETADYLTLSFGFVIHNLENTAPSHAFQQLINRADKCLYLAKQQGRNRTVGTHFN